MQHAAMADAACCILRPATKPRGEEGGIPPHRVQKKPEPSGMHRHGFWPASILKTKFSWLSYSPPLVLQRDSAAGASVSACATLSAQLGVDRVLLALRDSSYGTLVDTCAACNTIITNYVCHDINPPLKFLFLILAQKGKIDKYQMGYKTEI